MGENIPLENIPPDVAQSSASPLLYSTTCMETGQLIHDIRQFEEQGLQNGKQENPKSTRKDSEGLDGLLTDASKCSKNDDDILYSPTKYSNDLPWDSSDSEEKSTSRHEGKQDPEEECFIDESIRRQLTESPNWLCITCQSNHGRLNVGSDKKVSPIFIIEAEKCPVDCQHVTVNNSTAKDAKKIANWIKYGAFDDSSCRFAIKSKIQCNPDILKWKDEQYSNYSLFHWLSSKPQNKFDSALPDVNFYFDTDNVNDQTAWNYLFAGMDCSNFGLDDVNDHGETPLDLAVQKRNHEALEWLLKAGTKVSAKTKKLCNETTDAKTKESLSKVICQRFKANISGNTKADYNINDAYTLIYGCFFAKSHMLKWIKRIKLESTEIKEAYQVYKEFFMQTLIGKIGTNEEIQKHLHSNEWILFNTNDLISLKSQVAERIKEVDNGKARQDVINLFNVFVTVQYYRSMAEPNLTVKLYNEKKIDEGILSRLRAIYTKIVFDCNPCDVVASLEALEEDTASIIKHIIVSGLKITAEENTNIDDYIIRQTSKPESLSYTDEPKRISDTLEVCETLYAWKIIGSKMVSHPSFKDESNLTKCIDNKLKQLPSRIFIREIIAIVSKYKSLEHASLAELESLEILYLQVFASQKMAKSWLRLATICLRSIDMKDIIFSSVNHDIHLQPLIRRTTNTVDSQFVADLKFSEFINDTLVRKFSDYAEEKRSGHSNSRKRTSVQHLENNGILFEFVIAFLPYLVENNLRYPKSSKALIDNLLKYLNLLNDVKQSLELFDRCKVGDDVMKNFLELFMTAARKPREFGHKDIDSRTLVYMAKVFTSYLFDVRNSYPISFEKAKLAMMHAHDYDMISIKRSVNQGAFFRKSDRCILWMELTELIPAPTPLNKTSNWFGTNRIPSLALIINMIFDYILDVFLAIDYWYWNQYKAHYQCTFTMTPMNSSVVGDALCIADEINQSSFNCTFSQNFANGVSRTCNYGNQTDVTCPMLDKTTRIDSIGCSIKSMNENVASGISISILSLTHILHFVVFAANQKSYGILVSYILGDCCLKRSSTNVLQRGKYKCHYAIRAVITALLCLFLPFVTKLFVIVVMGIQLFQIEFNQKLFQKLGIKNSDFREKIAEPCLHCNGCSNENVHICIFCGALKGTSSTTQDKEKDFMENVANIRSNLMYLDRVDRLTTGMLENSYCPLVQVFLVLPLLINKSSTQTWALHDSATFGEVAISVGYWVKLVLTGISISSSLVGLASTAIQLHFSKNKKAGFRGDPFLNFTFQIGTCLQIGGRLFLFIAFGYVVFNNDPLAVLYIATMLFCHCLILLCVKKYLAPQILSFFYPQRCVNIQKQFLSSFLSTYVHVEWEDDENTNPSYHLSPSLILKDVYGKNGISQQYDFDEFSAINDIFYSLLGHEIMHSHENAQSIANSLDRIWSGVIFWTEQGAMTGTILYFWMYKTVPHDFNVEYFLPIITALFMVGNLLEWKYHVSFPSAETKNGFGIKTNVVNGLLFLLTMAIMAAVIIISFGYFQNWQLSIALGVFIVILLLSIGVLHFMALVRHAEGIIKSCIVAKEIHVDV